MTTLALDGGRYAPGESIGGVAAWTLPAAPKRVELRLFWQTEGRGDRDAGTPWELVLEAPAADDRREFSVVAPASPVTFAGKLITISWAVELVIDGRSAALADLVIGPGGLSVDLSTKDWLRMDDPAAGRKRLWGR